MINFFIIDYYFLITIIVLFFINFCNFKKDFIYKNKISTLINILKVMSFFILLNLIILNINFNKNVTDIIIINHSFVCLFKIFFFLFFFLFLFFFDAYIKIIKWNNFEYFFVFTVSVFSLSLLTQTLNFTYFYLVLEMYTLSFCSSLLIKKISKNYAEACFKYLILNCVSSCLLLFGMSLLYLSTGLLDFVQISKFFSNFFYDGIFRQFFSIGYFIVCFSFFLKLAFFPFNIIIYRIYNALSLNVLFFILIFPKFTFTLVFYNFLLNGLEIENITILGQPYLFFILFYFSLLVSFLHSIKLIYAFNLKSLIVNYSFSNFFFFVIPLIFKSPFILTAFFMYVLIYFLNFLCLFTFIFLFCLNYKSFIKKINNFISLYEVNPTLAILLIFNILSLLSIPPFYGFFIKFYFFYLLLQYKYYFLYFFLSIINLIIVYCFLRMVRLFFLKKKNVHLKFLKIEKSFLTYFVSIFSIINITSLFFFDFLYQIIFILLNSSLIV